MASSREMSLRIPSAPLIEKEVLPSFEKDFAEIHSRSSQVSQSSPAKPDFEVSFIRKQLDISGIIGEIFTIPEIEEKPLEL